MLKQFKMNIKPIKTRKDYEQALDRLELIFDAKKGTEKGDELEILGMLIDNYENEKFPIGFPDPVEAIKFRMEQLCYNQTDLQVYKNFQSAQEGIAKAINVYNHLHPHSSISYKKPIDVHNSNEPVERKWKNYYAKMELQKVEFNDEMYR
jgi:antitoxin component HigA of HigAB toxin-antitoxin module